MALFVVVANYAMAQTCPSDNKRTKPDSQYIIAGEHKELVLDTHTGLMWMRCTLGQSWDGSSCVGVEEAYNWQQVLNSGESHSFAGFDDWRVPNIKELGSLVETACYNPSINETIFPNTLNEYYRSSTPYSDHPDYAWSVYFGSGLVGTYYKAGFLPGRLVRIGQ